MSEARFYNTSDFPSRDACRGWLRQMGHSLMLGTRILDHQSSEHLHLLPAARTSSYSPEAVLFSIQSRHSLEFLPYHVPDNAHGRRTGLEYVWKIVEHPTKES
ncbi:hypothetical protein HC256_009261 [Beauveria bassiana]|nr:hypothetical protein HC256_009261 [Beauveria bassiana]